jgi:hypothetical protein
MDETLRLVLWNEMQQFKVLRSRELAAENIERLALRLKVARQAGLIRQLLIALYGASSMSGTDNWLRFCQ